MSDAVACVRVNDTIVVVLVVVARVIVLVLAVTVATWVGLNTTPVVQKRAVVKVWVPVGDVGPGGVLVVARRLTLAEEIEVVLGIGERAVLPMGTKPEDVGTVKVEPL